VDAASQQADPISPGKIVVVYGAGMGPSQLVQNQPKNSQIRTELSGTTVSFNGLAAPILYTSATQVAALVPYALSGSAARVTVTYQGEVSADFTVLVATAAPNVFTFNQAGWGQAAGINASDGTVNTAAHPVKIGDYISLYATGEGQTAPGGVDGKLGSTQTRPVLPVSVTVDGIPAFVQYAGGAPGQVAGLMQVNVQIPNGVQPGGYVPVVLQVGDRTSGTAVWIAVSGN
jgi:trimeric autotransporter adhesin